MGVIVRPDDLGSIMAGVYARLEAIERTSGPMHDFAIRDSNGVLRVAGGNLPALGISPAQEGLRVVDQYGNPIFDTLGLTSVMQSLGGCHPGGSFTSTSIAEYPTDGHASISVSRPVTIFALCQITLALSGTGAFITYFNLGFGLDSTTAFDYADAAPAAMPAYSAYSSGGPATLFMVAQVAAGTHTISLLGQNLTGNPAGSLGGLMKVFQLGA